MSVVSRVGFLRSVLIVHIRYFEQHFVVYPLALPPHPELGSEFSSSSSWSNPLFYHECLLCSVTLQNISSPEASPAHRPESVSPEVSSLPTHHLQPYSPSPNPSALCIFDPQPCLRSDCDGPPFHDLSLHSSLGSPATATEDFSLPGAALGKESQVPAPASCPPSDPPPGREQAFRTEFNLIYTCSPLNANLGAPPPAVDQCFSPAEPFCGGLSSRGPLGDAGPACMSPYSEPHYSAGYPDSCTPPHPSNPPTKKKASCLGLCDVNRRVNVVGYVVHVELELTAPVLFMLS